MKKIFIILFLLPCFCKAQIKPFMGIWRGTAATPTVFWQMNFENEYQTTSPAGWQNLYATPTNISTTGAVSFPSINTSAGTAPTISFVNDTGFVTYYNADTTAANTGVFPNQIIARGWQFNSGAQFTIGNLVAGQLYYVYVLSNAKNFEASVVSFSVQGITTNQVNNSDNFGSSTTNPWYTDASLCKLQFTPTTTSVTFTCNIVSGTTKAPINAFIIAK